MFNVGDRFRVVEQPFDITAYSIKVGDEGVIVEPDVEDSEYDWFVKMDNGNRWWLQECAMENLSAPLPSQLETDLSRILGL